MNQKSIIRGDENIEFIQTKEVVRKNGVVLKKTTELLEHERMSIMSDIFFKTMILNETRIKYSCKLLSYIIRYDYEELLENMRFTKNNFDKNVVNDKGVVGDFVTEIDDYKVNIEVNVNRNESRNFHYLAKLFASKAKVGSSGKDFNPSIQVNFNNYAYENDEKTKRVIHMLDEDGKVFLDIYIVEYYLPNIIKKMYNKGTESLSEDERIVLAMFTEDKNMAGELAKGDVVLKEFEEEVEVAMQDDDLKEAYDHFLDYGDGMRDEGFKDGFEQGIERGEQQAFIETAKKMLSAGEEISKIQEYTNLPIKNIEAIREDLKREQQN